MIDIKMTVNDIKRFIGKVRVDPKTDAWVFTGGISNNGYGNFWLNGKTVLAHRVSYFIKNGEIPLGSMICHKHEELGKNNVNPDHLFIGSHNDNMADAANKGRMANGSRNGQSKLSEKDVSEILGNTSLSQKQLSIKYNISQVKISGILRGDSWSHMPGSKNTGKLSLKNKSGYRGVRVAPSGKFEVFITAFVNGSKKTMYLGRYQDIVEAATVFDDASKKYHGTDAILNF